MAGNLPPEYLTTQVLERREFATACTARDLGEMLRIAVKWGGPNFTVSYVARRCEMSISQVSDYMKRGRRASRLEIFERVADGLHIPGHMLGINRRAWESDSLGSSNESQGPLAETVNAAYHGRGSVTRGQWNSIIRDASECIWLYGMTEFGYATDDEVPVVLADVTARGGEVKILLLDPEYDGTESIDADEGSPPGTLSTRIRASLARFGRMQETCGQTLAIRLYNSHPSASIVRGDERMIVTPYLGFSTGSNSPTFEFESDSAPRIFERYERHFDRTWRLAKDWT
jgi:hypothetical protein